jgi:hypothetical protein
VPLTQENTRLSRLDMRVRSLSRFIEFVFLRRELSFGLWDREVFVSLNTFKSKNLLVFQVDLIG